MVVGGDAPSVTYVIVTKGLARSHCGVICSGTADDTTRDERGPDAQPHGAIAFGPRRHLQLLDAAHVLRLVPRHLFEMTGDQDTPSRLVGAVEVVDLERRVALTYVEARPGHRAEHDVVAVERVVDRQDHRRRAHDDRDTADLLLREQ